VLRSAMLGVAGRRRACVSSGRHTACCMSCASPASSLKIAQQASSFAQANQACKCDTAVLWSGCGGLRSVRCCGRAPPASAHSSPTCAIAPPLLPLVILTFILMASSVLSLLQAIVEVVEACMKGEGANARKHVRLRTPIHPFTLPLPHLRSQHVSAASRCWPVWLLLSSLLRDL